MWLGVRKRDYKAAAAAHRRFLAAAAEKEDYLLVPLDLYNAACCLNLAGEFAEAESRLRACFELQRSGRVDPSQLLKRKLFERDPEIEALRSTAMFREQFAETFPKKDGDEARKADGKGPSPNDESAGSGGGA